MTKKLAATDDLAALRSGLCRDLWDWFCKRNSSQTAHNVKKRMEDMFGKKISLQDDSPAQWAACFLEETADESIEPDFTIRTQRIYIGGNGQLVEHEPMGAGQSTSSFSSSIATLSEWQRFIDTVASQGLAFLDIRQNFMISPTGHLSLRSFEGSYQIRGTEEGIRAACDFATSTGPIRISYDEEVDSFTLERGSRLKEPALPEAESV